MSSPSSPTSGSGSSDWSEGRYYGTIDNTVKGDVATHGGVVESPGNQKTFQCSTVPGLDIAKKTRIIGVCGIIDNEGDASPQESGWFFSDFFLFQHLFRDLANNQTWLSAQGTAPQELLNKYGDKLPQGICLVLQKVRNRARLY